MSTITLTINGISTEVLRVPFSSTLIKVGNEIGGENTMECTIPEFKGDGKCIHVMDTACQLMDTCNDEECGPMMAALAKSNPGMVEHLYTLFNYFELKPKYRKHMKYFVRVHEQAVEFVFNPPEGCDIKAFKAEVNYDTIVSRTPGGVAVIDVVAETDAQPTASGTSKKRKVSGKVAVKVAGKKERSGADCLKFVDCMYTEAGAGAKKVNFSISIMEESKFEVDKLIADGIVHVVDSLIAKGQCAIDDFKKMCHFAAHNKSVMQSRRDDLVKMIDASGDHRVIMMTESLMPDNKVQSRRSPPSAVSGTFYITSYQIVDDVMVIELSLNDTEVSQSQ